MEHFYSNDGSSPKKSWFHISVKSVKPFWYKKKLRIFSIAYTLLCKLNLMVTITSHIYINIFQTVHFAAVKFTKGNEKKSSFLLIPKSQQKVWKKSDAIGPGTFKMSGLIYSTKRNTENVGVYSKSQGFCICTINQLYQGGILLHKLNSMVRRHVWLH